MDVRDDFVLEVEMYDGKRWFICWFFIRIRSIAYPVGAQPTERLGLGFVSIFVFVIPSSENSIH